MQMKAAKVHKFNSHSSAFIYLAYICSFSIDEWGLNISPPAD